jgi:hypothetical protein
VLTLNRLAVGEAGTLMDRIAGNHALPAGVCQDIIVRTDGIPLFVEEMTKAVLEAGRERAARDTAASVPLTAVAVPASLHASLMASARTPCHSRRGKCSGFRHTGSCHRDCRPRRRSGRQRDWRRRVSQK